MLTKKKNNKKHPVYTLLEHTQTLINKNVITVNCKLLSTVNNDKYIELFAAIHYFCKNFHLICLAGSLIRL